MTQTYFGMFRRAAIAWSDVFLDLETRWNAARTRILDPKGEGYETKHFMRDALSTWMSGLQAWEKTWMPMAGQAGLPIVFLKGPNFVGEVALDPPAKTLDLYASDLWLAGREGWIPAREVTPSITPNGVLKVQITPKGREGRYPGLYRGLVYIDETGTPKVLAEIVLELPLKQD